MKNGSIDMQMTLLCLEAEWVSHKAMKSFMHCAKMLLMFQKKYSAKFIYTLGGFHTNRQLGKDPQTFVTATSTELKEQLEKSKFETTPQKSLITGFNGLVLGYAKSNGISGIGLYAELNEPEIPQYRAARSIIKTLEKLTYQKLGITTELDAMADDIDEKMKHYWPPKFKQ